MIVVKEIWELIGVLVECVVNGVVFVYDVGCMMGDVVCVVKCVIDIIGEILVVLDE